MAAAGEALPQLQEPVERVFLEEQEALVLQLAPVPPGLNPVGEAAEARPVVGRVEPVKSVLPSFKDLRTKIE